MSAEPAALLYDAHAPALYRFLMSLTGSEPDTRDLLQDLFVRLARRENAEALHDPQAYLFRAARNLAADLARNRSRRRRAMEALEGETAAHGLLFHPVPEEPDDARRQLRLRLSAALQELPEEQRAVVHLKIWENLTFARIAEVLGIPPDTAASRHRYALARLRQALTPAAAFLTP